MISNEAIAFREFFLEANAKEKLLTVKGTHEILRIRAITNDNPVIPSPIKAKIRKKEIGGFPVFHLGEQDLSPKGELFLYLHGGAYTNQPQPNHWEFADKIVTEFGISVVLCVYPKAPKYNYRDAYDFVLKVYSDLCREGYDRIYLVGDSSGAGFALGFTQWLKELGKRMPDKLVLISPWLDLTMKNPEIESLNDVEVMLGVPGLVEMGRSWAGGDDPNTYRLSPINGDLRDLPPTLMIVGTHELFLPDARMLSDIARSADFDLKYIEYPQMNHDFVILPIPEANEAFKIIADFIL